MEASRPPAAGVVPVPVAVPAEVIAAPPNGSTPLFTRHMPGAIEAGRDARRRHRRDARSRFRYRTLALGGQGPTHAPHVAAVAGSERFVSLESADVDRWTDEGGSYDAEAVASLRPTPSRR
jgi:hypothetical protein